MLPGRFKARRAAAEPIENNAGQKIDDRPQARLSERGAGAGDEDRQDGLSDRLRGVGEQWGQGGDRPAQRKQPVRPQRPREPVDADEADQRQHRLADEPQGQRAPDRDLTGKRQARARDRRADLGHVPVGADGQEEVEQKRDRDQAHGLDEPKPAKAADEGHDRAAGVDDERDRRAGRVEPPYVSPRAGQQPESERIIALKGEDRERRRVNRDQRRGIRALGPRRAQESERRCAGERGDDRFAPPRSPHRRQGRAAPRRRAPEPTARRIGAQRGAQRRKSSPCVRVLRLALGQLLCGLLTDSQAPRRGACGAPHSRPIWRLCARRD